MLTLVPLVADHASGAALVHAELLRRRSVPPLHGRQALAANLVRSSSSGLARTSATHARRLPHNHRVKSRGTLQRSVFFLIPYVLVAYPITRLYVTLILSRSPFSPSNIEDAAWLGVSVVRYTTGVLVLGQVSYALEWLLRRQISKGREEVYEATVKSRGKGACASPRWSDPWTDAIS